MKHKAVNHFISGVVTTILLMVGVIISSPQNVDASTLYEQSGFSVDGSYPSSQTTYIYFPVGTSTPFGVSGTVYYITWYVSDPTAWQSWLASGGSHSPSSWSNFQTCSVPWTENAGCSGTQTGNQSSTTVSFNGNYMTFQLNTPKTLTGSEYVAINFQADTSVSFSGISSGVCRFRNPQSGTVDCSGSDTLGLTQPYIVLSDSSGFVPPVTSSSINYVSPSLNSGTTTAPVTYSWNASVIYPYIGLNVSITNIDTLQSTSTNWYFTETASSSVVYNLGNGLYSGVFSLICSDGLTCSEIASTTSIIVGSSGLSDDYLPSPSPISLFISSTKEKILTHFPLGYITDLVRILSTTTIGSLVVLDTTLPSALGFGTPEIKLDLTHSLDWILTSTSTIFQNGDTDNTKNFYEITSYYWKIIVYLLAGMYIIGRILGSNLISTRNHFGEQGALSDTSQTDDSYRLKEYLYNHRNKE